MFREKDEIDALVSFLENPANARHVPELYEVDLAKALLIVKNKDEKYVLKDKQEKIPVLLRGTRFGVEQVGYNVILADSAYRGKLGISPYIKTLYDIDDNKMIRMGILTLTAEVDEELPPLTLRISEVDAAMYLNPKIIKEVKEKPTAVSKEEEANPSNVEEMLSSTSAKKEPVIEKVKIKLEAVPKTVMKKRKEEPEPSGVEDYLRPYK